MSPILSENCSPGLLPLLQIHPVGFKPNIWQSLYCELCLLFDSHKGHNALNKSEQIGRMSSRFAAMKTCLNDLKLLVDQIPNEFNSLETEI